MMLKLLLYFLHISYWKNKSAEKIKSMQIKKFRKIFEYARDNSKFYRDLYAKHNILDLEIKTIDDIQKVPIINKDLLRKHKIEDVMTCESNDNLDFHYTSGSSGEPFQLVSTKFENFTAHVRFVKILMMHGYSPFKKMAVISRYNKNHKFKIEKTSRFNIIKYFQLFPKTTISVFDPIEDIINSLQLYTPFVVWSTPSILLLVANELKKRNERLNIPVIILMSESVSDSDLNLLKSYIGLTVLDTYGCMEAPSMAYSYNSVDYKDFFVSSVLPEVINIREFNDSKVGDIVITNLVNKTMPVIRYDLGDFVGVIDNLKFPNQKIGKVHGRYDDIIYFGNNYTLAHHHSYQMLKDFSECEKYKFIQYPNGEISLQLKIVDGYNKTEVEKKAKEIWSRYYPGFPINVEWVEKFEINKLTGKFKVIEKLKH